MRRWKPLAVLAGLAVLVAVGAVVLRPRPNRITQENFGRIQKGMSRAEVEAILGPPGDSRTAPTTDPVFLGLTPMTYPEEKTTLEFKWMGDSVLVMVNFGLNGTVTWKGQGLVHKREQGPLDNLLWRAERQWRRWFP